jgi:hypothetical protein
MVWRISAYSTPSGAARGSVVGSNFDVVKLKSQIALLGIISSWAWHGAEALDRAQIEDLDFARDNYVLKSKAFTPTSRREALAFIEGLKAHAGPLSNEEFLMAVAQIPAFSRNSHDSFNDAEGWFPQTCLPFRFIWFPDGMVVARAAPDHVDLLGARVQSIEGLTVDQLLFRLRRICGEPDAYARWNVNWAIANGGLLHALELAQSFDRLQFAFALPDGRRIERTIKFVKRADVPRGVGPVRLWSAEPSFGESGKGWRAAIKVEDEPLYLQEADEFFRMSPLPDLDALYIQFRANSTADARGEEIGPFVKEVQDELEHAHPKHLILDLRFDIGGNIDETRNLARVIGINVRERIYVMTGPYTFSAGIVMAAAVKHDGGDRVTIVGDHVGDNLRWWSEGKNECLPHSRYCLHVTTGLWDLLHGCARQKDCYGDRLNAQVNSLDPDLRAPLNSIAWLNGRDPGLDAIKADLASRAH